MVAVPAVSCAVAVNAAVEDPAGMVTVDGTVTIPLLLLVRQTKGAGGSHAIME